MERQVEVQPCFNREFIAEMSDIASASILQLESLADGHELPAAKYSSEKALLRGSLPFSAANLPEGMLLMDDDENVEDFLFKSEQPMDFEAQRSSDAKTDAVAEMEERISSAIREGRIQDVRTIMEEAQMHVSQDMEDAMGKKAAKAEAMDPNGPVNTALSHQLWRALISASAESVQAAVDADLPNYDFVDDINARTALHLSAVANQLALCKACVEHGVDPRRLDVYGREALAYAAMHGHTEVVAYLLSLPQAVADKGGIVNRLDLDGFSPLIHAIVRGHTDVVRLCLNFLRSMDAELPGKSESSDLSPLAIAAQRGYVEITRLLLEYGAKVEANTEGLMPQTLAARSGHKECLQLLIDANVDINATEKGTLCTPLFYAAEYGHAACVDMLLKAGASIEHVDEKGRHAVFYAAWYGWRECTLMLLEAHKKASSSLLPKSAHEPPAPGGPSMESDLDMEIDGIPSLHLPPPIIPFRTYGHNYLDKRFLLCFTLSNTSIVLHRPSAGDRPDIFPGLSSSLKLVVTPRGGGSNAQVAIPHTIVLPMADEREEITFQLSDSDQFYLECELFPTFGSARIAKAVLLPEVLSRLQRRTAIQLPLLDWQLSVVGHIRFFLECVCPYGSVQLQIGGRVETYWKSTLPGNNNPPLVVPPPTQTGFVGRTDGHDSHDTSSYVTASSLSGNYLRVKVQFTRDLVPVVCMSATLPVPVWGPRVAQVTVAEMQDIATKTSHNWDLPDDVTFYTLHDWEKKLSHSLVTLEHLLATLPLSIGVALEVEMDTDVKQSLNDCIDATLHAVYEAAGREKRSRRIFFSSAVPSACVALNWKQPNYAVFFINKATLAADSSAHTLPPEADPRQSSIAEAVRFAKGNNLLGVMMDASILESVPELVPAVKAASLLLITLSRPDPTSELAQISAQGLLGAPAIGNQHVFDGFLENNIIECTM